MYHLPSSWVRLSTAKIDKVVAWALQDEACEIRVEHMSRRTPFYTRNAQEYSKWLAYMLSTTQAAAQDSIDEFRELNSIALENLRKFLESAENRYHCYVD